MYLYIDILKDIETLKMIIIFFSLILCISIIIEIIKRIIKKRKDKNIK